MIEVRTGRAPLLLCGALALLAPLGVSADARADEAKWEHTCVTVSSALELVQQANQLGLTNWEMVALTTLKNSELLACFKRAYVGERPTPTPHLQGAKSGLLVVTCDPWCAVKLNGISIGNSPIRRNVPPGEYLLEASNPQHGDETVKFKVEPGKTTKLMLKLKKPRGP